MLRALHLLQHRARGIVLEKSDPRETSICGEDHDTAKEMVARYAISFALLTSSTSFLLVPIFFLLFCSVYILCFLWRPATTTSSFTRRPIKSSHGFSFLSCDWKEHAKIYQNPRMGYVQWLMCYASSVVFHWLLLFLCGIFCLLVLLIMPCSIFHFHLFGASQASISPLICCYMHAEVSIGQETSALFSFTFLCTSLNFLPASSC